MSLNVKTGSSNKPDPIEVGSHHGVCVGVIDLGTHRNEKYDVIQRRGMVIWELPDLRLSAQEGKSVPRVISKEYNLFITENTDLGKHLISWRGKPFAPEEGANFDLFTILGANCILSVVHSDKGFAKVDTVGKLMTNMSPKQPETPVMKFSIDVDGVENIPDNIPDWVKTKIMNSVEYKAATDVGDAGLIPF